MGQGKLVRDALEAVFSNDTNLTSGDINEWFQSLSIDERFGVMDSMTELLLSLHGKLPEKPHVVPVPGRVEVFSLAQSQIRHHRRSRGRRTRNRTSDP